VRTYDESDVICRINVTLAAHVLTFVVDVIEPFKHKRYNGVLTFTRLIGDYILDRSGAKSRGYYVSEGGVQYVQFPTKPYTENGFYATIQGT
jgi:hypothetical protein